MNKSLIKVFSLMIALAFSSVTFAADNERKHLTSEVKTENLSKGGSSAPPWSRMSTIINMLLS